jgi:IQ calmodulin-binding motif
MAAKIRQHLCRIKAHQEQADQRLKVTSATRLQSLWRKHKRHREFALVKRSTSLLQVILRSKIATKQFHIAQKAAVAIQKNWRSFWAQMQYQINLLDITSIQRIARRKIVMTTNGSMCQALSKLQRTVRGYVATRRHERKSRASKVLAISHLSAGVCQVCLRCVCYAMSDFDRHHTGLTRILLLS